MKKPATAKQKSKFTKSVGDVVAELKKVTWPTRHETIRLSLMVLVVCIIVGLILGGIDYGFTNLFEGIILGGG
jgi:preprotein translocase subunit SecE